ncbi:hypothetical protein A2380_01125 [candidate division WWE3 bacterium RIFOXYB1_FULL_43_24]|uniref:Uncharacterized protein n=2 Tax=Katanobacteria TaxID=422282 RepID=A0A0G1BPP2_UNCKA|nr:MAG: hypothetical protein UU92_C0001G0060 [candidate division WWE3 bacterium GW2011_GWA1_42_12]KKS35191.1 MAG: hypothetical protein UU97_C0001G0042 [candidate division WWE3 bacterium GW2011_GWD1_42_14]KKS39458.1 MAG: hypothetical protein UV00_C0001G0026 [candidate division WWE3 bacterium GW2011_GWF1_42_14]KKS40901.1 MAG: hypothetical protein UV03_C0001G0026 [candidate division WWE3 bacterium GW2011_GWE1_42_16]KKS67277.1 MAG: hypothetical protein UV35_C0001G0045 [candidate division WWE3 bacte
MFFPSVPLRLLPANSRVFVSPGAFVKFEGKLHINLNSYINDVYDPDRYFTVEVTRLEQGVLVNMSTLPEDLRPPEINNKTIIEKHFNPITKQGFRIVDAC